jgi:hypothetical protein
LQILTQLMHLGAGFGILGAHFFDESSKLADLILQVTNGSSGLSRRRGASSGRLLRPRTSAQ